ncbi:MAG: hypothetical protein K0R65_36 [Crocinitomicaceae bacterium]|jgi:RimJ/RimL family protein N-acetyltransferase|nr:hypothetical protein [Crocinitomicaceae bacterium]
MKDELSYRRVDFSDKDLLFEWTNDPVTRSNSFQSNAVAYDEHVNWLEKKLESPDTFYLIAEVSGEPAAFVRFDGISAETVIGINIAKDFRGKGLAGQILMDSCTLFHYQFEGDIYAYIKTENEASVKAFQKAGFHLVENVIIHNFKAYKYRLEQA